jgi:hypothetical protein
VEAAPDRLRLGSPPHTGGPDRVDDEAQTLGNRIRTWSFRWGRGERRIPVNPNSMQILAHQDMIVKRLASISSFSRSKGDRHVAPEP